MVIAVILVSLIEIILDAIGLYCLYRGVKALRTLASLGSPKEIWGQFSKVVFWSVGSSVALGASAVIGARAIVVIVIIMLLSVALCGTAILISVIRSRKLITHGREESRTGVVKNQQVVIKSLVPKRVRGMDEGVPVLLSPEDEEFIVGITGYVRMIPWAAASKARGPSGETPLLGFRDGRGTEILLYCDDLVQLDGGVPA
jgi:hypothetical protein